MKVVDVLQNRLIEAPADYALHACDQMGMQYLWVDQLCINQSDENEKMNQINQMDRIYASALCTLVALAGKDSNYGLPGVTRPRSWTHETVQIGDLTLATRAPSLATCIDCSTWSTRGWTLQEAMLSPRLLYFTEYGTYYEYPDPAYQEYPDPGVKFESNALCEPVTTYNFPTLDKHWSVVEQYTTRHLTFPSDALCAISAVLRAMHGDEGVYYRLPISQMDRAVVWVPTGNGSNTRRDGFPSWSWVSHDGPIMHPHVLAGLAIWMTPKRGSKSGLSICKPEDRIGAFRFDTRNAIDIAVAWLEGCISSQFPVDPRFNTETVYALAARWPTYEAFWGDAFGGFVNHNINLIEHYELAPGHILVYGQVAQFTLDTCEFGEKRDMFVVRSRAGIPSGAIWISAYNEIAPMNTTREFIALSVGDGAILGPALDLAFEKRFTKNPELDDYELQYQYGNAEILPVLNVMMVERNPESNIARRLGIGTIFLKEWADADREFKTVVLG
ncbi:heterokaryon incompatibility protein-domain-containing protein [Aspergillus transmontanensis]|uniref:Heterokaryon incompatibility protein-domain-containing protein n=1 Tax=Aspergillus transmontanensis TaxID=1034304 RepID=A0A5N6VI22_9EURO|nr:heterokaryon incompatibility protein-domain-containing protein [Aspergillus transmontanensis]